MRHRARKQCWFGRLYHPGEEADFAPGTRVPATLFDPLEPAAAPAPDPAAGPSGAPARMAGLRRQARELGIASRRSWTAADLTAAIAAAQAPAGAEASHGQ
jgi:hypothetical protein